MKYTKYCNIHDLVKIEINTNRVGKLYGIDFPFSYFEEDIISATPDIILNVGKFKPDIQNSITVDHKCYVKDNYFYCKENYGKAKFEFEIMGLEDETPVIINFYGKVRGIENILIPNYLAQNIALKPIIEILLLRKGYLSIHGLGIEKNGRAYI